MHGQTNIKPKISNLESQISTHLPALTILLAFIALCLIYSQATPPFEAGDESRHFAVVKYMAETGQLINQNAPDIQPLQHHWSHEGSQPPLYYALVAALTGWVKTDDAGARPRATAGALERAPVLGEAPGLD